MSKNRTIFTQEAHVRQWIRKNFGDACFWIEHAAGGTVGFADVLIAAYGRLWSVEAKKAERAASGDLIPKLRPTQKLVTRRMVRHDIPNWTLCGEVGTNRLWMIENRFLVAGELDRLAPVHDKITLLQAFREKLESEHVT